MIRTARTALRHLRRGAIIRKGQRGDGTPTVDVCRDCAYDLEDGEAIELLEDDDN